jgi:serine/threonine-protein kinase
VYEPGSVVAGKYRVEHLLGRGGMGIVVAAEHVDLRTRVALKFLSQEWSKHPVIVERFLREARACARLRSEHVCRVFDVARLDDGTPFLVLELLEGRDLLRALRADGPLDPATAAGYVIEACNALAEAHGVGIVHRDLKPANLFLARRDGGRSIVKVLDFGVAKAHDDNDTSITATDNVVGSPAYMSPEQLRSAVFADARSDIWSLGVLLVELVSGKKPFDGVSTIDLALKITSEPPTLSGEFPAALAGVAQRCLRKEPGERYQSVAELAAALDPIARGMVATTFALPPQTLEIITPTAPDMPATIAAVGTTTTLGSASGVVTGHRKRARAVYVLGAGMLAVAIGLAAAQLVRSSGSSDPPAPVPAAAPPAPVVMHVDPPPPAPPPPAPVVVVLDAGIAVDPDQAKPAVKKPAPPHHHAKTKEEIGASRE